MEETGRRHRLTEVVGDSCSAAIPREVADVVTGGSVVDDGGSLSRHRGRLQETRARDAALTQRSPRSRRSPKLAAKAKHDYGDAYCGGQIEASLAKGACG